MVESFLRYIRYEKNYSSRTAVSYKNDLLQFEDYLKETTGEFDPVLVDKDQVRNWISYLSGEKLNVTSIKRKVSALRSFFEFLKREGKIEESPLCFISSPKSRKKLPVFVKEEQMDALLDDVDFGSDFDGLRNKLIVEMLYTTGMRRAELVGLRDEDVDFFSSIIKVTGKGNKQRIIPFGDELKSLMNCYLDSRKSLFGGEAAAFFLKDDGLPIYPGLVYRVVRKYLSIVSSLGKRSPHVLRHTFATMMLENGAELSVVKELLGHASLSSTEIYTHVSSKEIMMNYNLAHPRANKKGGINGN